MIHSSSPATAARGFRRQTFRQSLLGLATVAGFSTGTAHAQFADPVLRPDEALPLLAAFLGVPEKLAAMPAVIEPGLHRARSSAELVAETA